MFACFLSFNKSTGNTVTDCRSGNTSLKPPSNTTIKTSKETQTHTQEWRARERDRKRLSICEGKKKNNNNVSSNFHTKPRATIWPHHYIHPIYWYSNDPFLCLSRSTHRKTKTISMLKLNPIKIHWLFRDIHRKLHEQSHTETQVSEGDAESIWRWWKYTFEWHWASQHNMFMRVSPFINFICFLLSSLSVVRHIHSPVIIAFILTLSLANYKISHNFQKIDRKAKASKKRRKKCKVKQSLNRTCAPIYQVITRICLMKTVKRLRIEFFERQ